MKKFFALTAACLLAFTMACDSGSSEAKVNDEDAMMMFEAVNEGIAEAYMEAFANMGVKAPGPSSGTFESVTNFEGTVSINGSWSDDGSGYITLNLTITFTNYVDSQGTVLNGSTTYDYEGTSDNFTYVVSGDFDVVLEGENHDFSWNMTITGNVSSSTFNGTFTVDGYSYSFSETESEIE